jgi:hypothetical protein
MLATPRAAGRVDEIAGLQEARFAYGGIQRSAEPWLDLGWDRPQHAPAGCRYGPIQLAHVLEPERVADRPPGQARILTRCTSDGRARSGTHSANSPTAMIAPSDRLLGTIANLTSWGFWPKPPKICSRRRGEVYQVQRPPDSAAALRNQ